MILQSCEKCTDLKELVWKLERELDDLKSNVETLESEVNMLWGKLD